jgi:hypothetical protein
MHKNRQRLLYNQTKTPTVMFSLFITSSLANFSIPQLSFNLFISRFINSFNFQHFTTKLLFLRFHTMGVQYPNSPQIKISGFKTTFRAHLNNNLWLNSLKYFYNFLYGRSSNVKIHNRCLCEEALRKSNEKITMTLLQKKENIKIEITHKLKKFHS